LCKERREHWDGAHNKLNNIKIFKAETITKKITIKHHLLSRS
jgi:hypothetical protein